MDIKIGDSFSTSREVTDEVIRKFAEVSGDFNPIHLDEEFAKTTRFGKRIAHGMLSGAFISAVLGNEFLRAKDRLSVADDEVCRVRVHRRYGHSNRDDHEYSQG